MNQTRRRLLAGAPALAVAGCAAIANTTTSPSTAVASAAATVNAGASSLWGIALGIGQEALTVLDVADPPLAAAVNGIIALGTSALTVVQSATSSATQVASASADLVTHASNLILQTAQAITVTPNPPA